MLPMDPWPWLVVHVLVPVESLYVSGHCRRPGAAMPLRCDASRAVARSFFSRGAPCKELEAAHKATGSLSPPPFSQGTNNR
jgi:hypothetical protein